MKTKLRKLLFYWLVVIVPLLFPKAYADYYDAPYRFNYAYGPNPWLPTIQEVIDFWWEEYKADWSYAFPGCSYSTTSLPNPHETGSFVRIGLHGTCRGGGIISGTLYTGNPPIHEDKNNTPLCEKDGTNPIHISIGFKLQQETDYRSKGISPLIFRRYYTSGDHWELSGLGHNWRHSYAKHIQLDDSTLYVVAYVYRANGDRIAYVRQNDGSWLSDPDVTGRLVSVDGGGWSYTDSKDNVEHYDESGKLTSIAYHSGHFQSLGYNSEGLLEMVADTFGYILHFAYDTHGRIETFTDPAGNIYRYGYDATDNLITVTYSDETPADPSDNPKRQYLYEDIRFPHALTGIIDENGNRYATWSYDSEGRATSSEHAYGIDRHSLVYNANGSTTVTNALNKQTTYYFEVIYGVSKVSWVEGHPTASCEGANKSYSYDANGNVISKTDWNGVTTTYTYDMDRNLELTRTEAVGTPQERTITTEWHPQFRLPTKIAEPGRVTEYTYDAQGRLLSSKVSGN